MVNKLIDFGHSFQIKMIVSLMTNLTYLEQIQDILDEKHFDNDGMKWIIKECKDYYQKYKKTITFDIFKVKTKEIQNDVVKTVVVESLKEIYQHYESNDLEFVQDKSLEFFKNQELKSAIMSSVDILESDGDFEQIKKLIDTAMNAGVEKNIGHEYVEDIELRYSEMARLTIDTPWDVINDAMQGGLANGELGVIVAPAGIGKSWVLSALGASAVKNGKTVVHYSLELNEAYTGLRYDSVFSGIANQNLKYHKDDVEKSIQDLDGELIIKYFPTKTASVHTIAAHLQKLKSFGKTVDLIIIDYADIMRDVQSAKEVRHQLGNVYEDLRGLSGEVEAPIWTASQANRSSLDEDVIEAQKVSESYVKVMVADFVMSLSRKVEDKIANTGRFHLIKNRFGPDGITFPAMVNTNNGKIDLYDGNSVGGKKTQSKIDNRDNITKRLLATKYDDLMGD